MTTAERLTPCTGTFPLRTWSLCLQTYALDHGPLPL
jgi:hypothetical protein